MTSPVTHELLDEAEQNLRWGQDILMKHPEEGPQIIFKSRQLVGQIARLYLQDPLALGDELAFLNRLEKMGMMLGSELGDDGHFFESIMERRSEIEDERG